MKQRDETETYELRIRGRLDPRWSSWFDGMTVALAADGITVITGPVVDQAALQGLLRKVHDMGIELIAVTQLGTGITTA